MAKHIHIHIHRKPTKDAVWEESKHPRKDDGKFGSGGGKSPSRAEAMKTAVHQARTAHENRSPEQQKKDVAARQAALRESGSPRYAGRTNTPAERKPGFGLGKAQPSKPKAHEAAHTSAAAAVAGSPKHKAEHERLLKLYDGSEHDWERAAMTRKITANGARAAQEGDKKKREADFKALEKHPMYAKEDFDYLKGKGYDPEEIKALWDRDHKAGKEPSRTNKNSPEMQEHFGLLRKAMGG